MIDPKPIAPEKGCEGDDCSEDNTDDDARFVVDYVDYGFLTTYEACKYETPEEQFRRVDVENITEVDFDGYMKMIDNCRRALKRVDFDRIDTNSKILFIYEI